MKRLAVVLLTLPLLAAQDLTRKDEPEKPDARQTARKLLDTAAKTVTSAQPQVQVAALLHLGASYHLLDSKKALEFLEQGFISAAELPSTRRNDLRGDMQAKAVERAADIDLDKAITLLRQMSPPVGHGDRRMRPAEKIVRLLLDKQDFDRAIELVESVGTTGDYPFLAARLIFEKLPAEDPRRAQVFASASTAYVGRPNGPFPDFLARHWQEVPKPVAEAALRAVLNAILERKDDMQMSSSISSAKGAITLNSRQDIELFNIMHVLRALDPKRASELLETRPELRGSVERFPMGTASMRSDEQADISTSVYRGSDRRSPEQASRDQLMALASSRMAEAMSVIRQDPQKALPLIRGIPVPFMQAEALASIARSVSDKDATTAKSVISQAIQILDDLKNPMERIRAWDIIAEAAYRAKDEQLAWQAIDRGLADAVALYKTDADAESPNEAAIEYWPSTQAFRRIVFRAARLFGAEAEPLLAKITDPDVALLARIETAAALLGRPSSPEEVRVSRASRNEQRQTDR